MLTYDRFFSMSSAASDTALKNVLPHTLSKPFGFVVGITYKFMINYQIKKIAHCSRP